MLFDKVFFTYNVFFLPLGLNKSSITAFILLLCVQLHLYSHLHSNMFG